MSTLILVDYYGKKADLERGRASGNLVFHWEWVDDAEEEMSEEEYTKYLEDCLAYQEAREKKLRETLHKMQVHDMAEEETSFNEKIDEWEAELLKKFHEKNGNAQLAELKMKTRGKKRVLSEFVMRMVERWKELRSQSTES